MSDFNTLNTSHSKTSYLIVLRWACICLRLQISYVDWNLWNAFSVFKSKNTKNEIIILKTKKKTNLKENIFIVEKKNAFRHDPSYETPTLIGRKYFPIILWKKSDF